ncbi:MAG TPA: M13 family metallopeptidase, partial [Terriglobia bacterium]
TTCKPCDDFYQFVNGAWLKDNPVPAAYARWGTFQILAEQNLDILRGILQDAAAANAPKGDEQIIGSFYTSCMDEARIEGLGASPISADLARIDRIRNTSDLQAEFVRLHQEGIPAVFLFGASFDFNDSSRRIAWAVQGGLTLENKDYYTSNDDKSKQTRDEFLKHAARMLELLGDSHDVSAKEAAAILKIETQLAEVSLTPAERRDPKSQLNKRSMAELAAMTPHFSWQDYMAGRGAPPVPLVNIGQPKFFEGFDRMLSSTSVADWKTYLRWHVLHDAAPRLSAKFVDEDFDFFGKTLTGAKELQPRWRRCVTAADSLVGDALGKVYIEKKFRPEARARMNTMIDNLVSAYRDRLQKSDWMSPATRDQALVKLAAFTRKIGNTERWKDYSSLRLTRDAYYGNVRQAAALEEKRDIDKIEKPVDKGEWSMTPPTVNAYYNSSNNEIVFPAGILQPPFFDAGADDALNYGAIGAVIGHEITHGFDDSGSQFDPQGNLRNWWTEADRSKFSSRAECVEEQFSGYQTVDGTNLNGKLVLGESIGDLGGITIAYDALKKSMEGKPRPANIDGFTPEQRFFIGWGVVWAMSQRPESERQQALSDPHPLSRFRVNGPLSNLPEFAAAFGCKAGDTMVRAANRRCQVW